MQSTYTTPRFPRPAPLIVVCFALIALSLSVFAASSFGLIPWNTLPDPQSPWSALTQVSIASNTVKLCTALAVAFAMYLLGTMTLSWQAIRQWVGDGPVVLLSRLGCFFGILGVMTVSCFAVNWHRSVGAVPPADQLVHPGSGPQLGFAFFLHGADDDGIVVTVVTLGAIGLFSLLGILVGHRHLQVVPRWLVWTSHSAAVIVGMGVWVSLDHLLSGSPAIPLSDAIYAIVVFICLTAVPVAYLLMVVEVSIVQWKSTAGYWREGRRIRSGVLLRSLLLWVVAVTAPVGFGLYLALWYTPSSNAQIYDSQGNLIDIRNPGYSTLSIPAEEVPEAAMQAVESIEDPGLLSSPSTHSPINPVTLIGSAVRLVSGGPSSGGSGLASQVCKIQSGTPLSRSATGHMYQVRRLVEKAFETPCAWTLEKVGGPERTISLWLNSANYACLGEYGASEVRGLGAASLVFFGKRAVDLSVPELALLVRLPQSPCAPYGLYAWGNEEEMVFGRNQVLTAMSERQGYLSDQDAALFSMLPLGVPEVPYMPPEEDGGYIEEVMGDLDRQGYGGFSRNGWTVDTTLDSSAQQMLEDACDSAIANQTAGNLSANDCGGILLRRSSSAKNQFEVAAYVGTTYSVAGPDAMPDLVSDKPLPVGSTIKGPLYACALQAGILEPGDWLNDPGTTKFPNSEDPVANWDNDAIGRAPAEEMLIESRNVPAARLVQELSPDAFAACLDDTFGVTSELDLDLDVRLGLGLSPMTLYELAVAYTPFATGGTLVLPVMVEEVLDRDGNPVRLTDPQKAQKVLSCDDATWVTSALEVVGENFGLPTGVAAKTGTTETSSVAVAYSGDWVLAVWLGNIDPTAPLNQVDPNPTAMTVVQQVTWSLADQVAWPTAPVCGAKAHVQNEKDASSTLAKVTILSEDRQTRWGGEPGRRTARRRRRALGDYRLQSRRFEC